MVQRVQHVQLQKQTIMSEDHHHLEDVSKPSGSSHAEEPIEVVQYSTRLLIKKSYIQLVVYAKQVILWVANLSRGKHMALAHTILVLLTRECSSGYDLAKHFSESVGYFWQASQQQIYRELAKLEDQGWVESETVIQEGRPNKKIYQITPLGLTKLQEWIAMPSEPMAIREDLLVKVAGGDLVSRATIRHEVEHRRHVHQAQLAVYLQKQEEEFCPLEDHSLAHQFLYLTLRRGIRYESSWVEWCDEVLNYLDQMDAEETLSVHDLRIPLSQSLDH